MRGPLPCTVFVFDIGTQHRLLHDAGVFALQPVIPPALRFLQEPYGGPRCAIMCIDMSPRSENSETRHFQSRKQARQRVCISIRPTTRDHHGHIDCIPIFIHRPMFPIVIATLMLHPEHGPIGHGFNAVNPVLAPARPNNSGIKRTCLIGMHDRTPPEIVIQQTAAHVMNIVIIAVISRANREHSF